MLSNWSFDQIESTLQVGSSVQYNFWLIKILWHFIPEVSFIGEGSFERLLAFPMSDEMGAKEKFRKGKRGVVEWNGKKGSKEETKTAREQEE